MLHRRRNVTWAWAMVAVYFSGGGFAVAGEASPPRADDAAAAGGAVDELPLAPIDVSGFGSSIHHWRKLRASGRFIEPAPEQPSYAPEQVREIAANILLFQRADGGWPKDYDMLAVLSPEQQRRVAATRDRADSSFDNGNVHSQVAYLAQAYAQAGEPTWRAACERGLDFMLLAQYPSGGFPQRFPEPRSYHAHITFNDGVMIGILNVLQDAAEGRPHFAWLDPERRSRAAAAVERGVDCILRCQIEVEGRKTGWCQQHDPRSFAPRPARTFELASICPQDTTEIVRFLMRQSSPSAAVTDAIEEAAQWLATVQLAGVRVDRVKAPREDYPGFATDVDVVVVEDVAAPPLWARHYEIGTNRPIFAGRDGVKKYALAEIERERRTGTAWYGAWPRRLLEAELPAWRAQQAAPTEAPAP